LQEFPPSVQPITQTHTIITISQDLCNESVDVSDSIETQKEGGDDIEDARVGILRQERVQVAQVVRRIGGEKRTSDEIKP